MRFPFSFFSLILLITSLFSSVFADTEQDAAMNVIKRFTKDDNIPVTLQPLDKKEGNDTFETKYEGGVLEIKATSGVAYCRGFYDFIKEHKAGINSWSGNRWDKKKLPENASQKRVTSPFQHHYYFNVVTYGYSLPYWNWERWEKEIDWMALHGIDMPLALVANEAITARVWKKLGLTDEEISAYFVGPAHLPWMRMGNISGIDGPLPQEWHQNQIALQHKILDRMKSLGMKPVCPGFAGFVPPAIKRLYPEANLVETKWAGVFKNWMISPDQELFSKIGTMFIQEWEKEFGKNNYYLIDSFNEMEIPFPPVGTDERYSLLTSYGDKVYGAIKAANPDATWVMQGWMFGYQRYIWDQDTLAALIKNIPNDKMILLDLAADYNKHFWRNGMNWDFYKGFFNKQWVYSVIPNMGGKTGFTGVLEFYANGHLEALNSTNKGNLVGFGMAPEGIENNEVIYELLSDAGWSNKTISLETWLSNYRTTRYGTDNSTLKKAWDGLLTSVYGSFTDHPRYNWQFRPGRVGKGSINANEDFFKAVETMASITSEYKDSKLFQDDMIEMTALYLGAKLEILINQIESEYMFDRSKDAADKEKLMEELFLGMDRILQSHSILKLEDWLNYAIQNSNDPALKKYYERNARRLVTIWAPPIDDYSARIWSGLVRDYYLPRWQHYWKAKKMETPFNFNEWEKNWVENTTGVSKIEPYADTLAACVSLIKTAKDITVQKETDLKNTQSLGTWSPAEVSAEWKEISWTLPAELLPRVKGVLFTYVKGVNKLEISKVQLELDGKVITEKSHKGETGINSKDNFYALKIPADTRANNSSLIKATVKSDGNANSYGNVILILSEQ